MIKKGKVKRGDGKDVSHKNGNPRDNRPKNLTVERQSKNRSYRRTRTAGKLHRTAQRGNDMSKKKDPKVIRPADLGITKKQAIDLIKLLENKAPANAEKLKKSLFPAGIANYNKGGNVMPMHGKKKSKMMQRGGAAKKTKMMKRVVLL